MAFRRVQARRPPEKSVRGRGKTGFAVQEAKREKARRSLEKSVVDQDGELVDPLACADADREDQIWASPAIEDEIFTALCLGGDKEDIARCIDQLMMIITKEYSLLAMRMQLEMLKSSTIHSGLTRLVSEPGEDAVRLEEPFSWRQMQAPDGVNMFAADLFVLQEVQATPVQVFRGAAKSKGFASTPVAEFEDDMGQLLDTEDTSDFKYQWLLIRMIAEQFVPLSSTWALTPRVVLPAAFARRLRRESVDTFRDNFEDCEIVEFSGPLPSARVLLTGEHSVVLVVMEPRIPPDELSWAFPYGDDFVAPHGESKLAPIICLSFLQQCMELPANPVFKRLLGVFRRAMEGKETPPDPSTDGQASSSENASSSLRGFFEPFASIIRGTMPNEEDSKQTRIAARIARELQPELAPLITKAYSRGWAKLRERRLGMLQKAKESLGRREEEIKRVDSTRAALKEAIARLDTARFEKEVASALREKRSLPAAEQEELAKKLAAEIALAEKPIRALVDSICNGVADNGTALGPLSIKSFEKLDETISASPLLPGNRWRKVAEDLRGAIVAIVRLQEASAQRQAGNGREQVKTLEEALARSKRSVSQFERSVKLLHGPVGPDGAVALQQALLVGQQALDTARKDCALREILAAAPWNQRAPRLDELTPQAVAALDAALAQASTDVMSKLADSVQRALAFSRCATALRKLLGGTDRDALTKYFREAQRIDICGLESVERRLEELEGAVTRIGRELQGAAESLDLARFEQALEEARQSRVPVPAEDEGELRRHIENGISLEETKLDQLVARTDLTQRDCCDALSLCRLPSSHPQRHIVEVLCEAFQSLENIQAVLRDPNDVDAVENALDDGAENAALVQDCLASAGHPEGCLQVLADLQAAVDLCSKTLALKRSDDELQAILARPPWGPDAPSWQDIKPAHVSELESAAESASQDGRTRVFEELGTALARAHCAAAIEDALQEADTDALTSALEEARRLGLQGIEVAEARAQALKSPRSIGQTSSAQKPEANSSITLAWDDASSSRSWDTDDGSTNMIFLDLELTAGFYDFHVEPRILEVAVIVTDKDLCELGRGHWTIGELNREGLNSLGDFHQAHFRDAHPGGHFPPLDPLSGGGNGLFTDVLRSRLSTEQAENEIMGLLRRYCPPGACPLAGYSVQCDREVLRDQMPRFYQYVSHQIIDVSTFYQAARLWSRDGVHKLWERRPTLYNHRALNDVEDSIQSLRLVRKCLF